ncbi:hypothetical protein BW39_00692 [Delftia sp. RIT313]|nr:hypothetical protein BW39_00692 [Delftia sp. RIT313]
MGQAVGLGVEFAIAEALCSATQSGRMGLPARMLLDAAVQGMAGGEMP